MSTVVAALAAGAAACLLVPGRSRWRVPVPAPVPTEDVGRLRRLRYAVAPAVLLGTWVLLGGAVGVVAGLLAGWLCWRVLGSAEGPAAVLRREQLARDLPAAVDLLASCLQAGSSLDASLLTVADALGGPVAEELRGVHHRLALGVAPADAWAGLEAHELRPLVRAVLRAHESGAGVSEAVTRLAADLRERARSEVLARASAVEVQAAGPLAACFLPAFLLLAVVPLVAASLTGVELFG